MLIKQYHNIIWLQFQGVATMWCHRMTKWIKTMIISIFPYKESFLIIRFTKINHEINAPCALVGFEHSLCCVYNHLHYVSCISCWALFAYSVPQMFNCTSSAQVHGLYIYIFAAFTSKRVVLIRRTSLLWSSLLSCSKVLMSKKGRNASATTLDGSLVTKHALCSSM